MESRNFINFLMEIAYYWSIIFSLICIRMVQLSLFTKNFPEALGLDDFQAIRLEQQKMLGIAGLLFFSLLLSCSSAAFPSVDLLFHSYSPLSYEILLDSRSWLNSSDTRLHINGVTHSALLGSLKLVSGPSYSSGSDVVGSFNETEFLFQAEETPFLISFRQYDNLPAILFNQSFPKGALNTSTQVLNSVCADFPSFRIPTAAEISLENPPEPLGVHTFSGPFLWYGGDYLFQQNPEALPIDISGDVSAPHVLFDSHGRLTSFIAPFNSFMGSSFFWTHQNFSVGPIGTAESLEPGYSTATMMYFGSSGINSTIQEWGNIMRRVYQKARWNEEDPTVKYLGWNTDNGAYYYYNTEPGTNYEETLLDLYKTFVSQSIPVHFLLLDSWWYQKGKLNGVKNWTATEEIFPNGMNSVHERTNYSFILHNRYWAPDNIYSNLHGGNYSFIEEEYGSMPMDERFWPDLMRNASKNGLLVYEQDWLYNEFNNVLSVQRNLSLGRLWLKQMNAGAEENQLFIQYCMPAGRQWLQSIELSAVSQIRCSDDYQPGNHNWRIGETAILASALGLHCLKDNFWSGEKQPGSPYQGKIEPNSYLQGAISSMSRGTVTPGDGKNLWNLPLIARSHRSDGFLLKADVPAVSIDSVFVYRAFHDSINGASGQILHSFTEFSSYRWHFVIAAELIHPYSFSYKDLHIDSSDEKEISYLAYSYSPPNCNSSSLEGDEEIMSFSPRFSPFNSSSPWNLSNSTARCFDFLYISPIMADLGLVLLGEFNKWIPISAGRISQLSISGQALMISLIGAPGEQVEFAVHFLESSTTAIIPCVIDYKGEAQMIIQADHQQYKCA